MFELRSDEIKEFTKAFCEYQSKMQPVEKDSGGQYNCALLETLYFRAEQILSTCGISINQGQTTHDNKIYIITELMHTSGEWKRSYDYLCPETFVTKENIQKVGTMKTYVSRYAIKNFLCLSTPDQDEDDYPKANNNNVNQEADDSMYVTKAQNNALWDKAKSNKDIMKLLREQLGVNDSRKILAEDFDRAMDILEVLMKGIK